MQTQHILAMPELALAIRDYLEKRRGVKDIPENVNTNIEQKAVGLGGEQVLIVNIEEAVAPKRRGRIPNAEKAAQVAQAEKALATKKRGRRASKA